MGLYTAPSIELLCQQVVRDNPQLAGKVTPDAFGVRGNPVATTANGRNTQITLVGLPGKGFKGELTVYYDRVNLVSLFQGTTLSITIPRSAKTNGTTLPALNAKYGLNLQPSDILYPDRAISHLASPLTLKLDTSTSSLNFIGSISLQYIPEPLGYYPNSGPGTKYLMAGNELNGYFGLVKPEELLTALDIAKVVFLGGKIPSFNNFNWMKFFLNGKVVYLASRGIFYTSWDALYRAGCIFGTEGPGKRPLYIKNDVDQSTLLSCKDGDKTAYLRLSTPFYQEGVDNPVLSTGPSDNSIYKLTKKLGNYTSVGEWGQLSSSDGYLGDEIWTRHHNTNDQAYYIAMDSSMQRNTYVYVSAVWSPMLELIDPSTIVLPLTDVELEVKWLARGLSVTSSNPQNVVSIHPLEVNFSSDEVPRPLPTTATFDGGGIQPLEVLAPSVSMPRPLAGDAEQTTEPVKPVEILSPGSVDVRPLVVQAKKIDGTLKTNISTANGELDGFL